MEEIPTPQRQRKLSSGRPRAQSDADVPSPRLLETPALGQSRESIFYHSHIHSTNPTSITEGLIDVDHTLKFGKDFNQSLLNLLFRKDVLDLCLFTKMKNFKVFLPHGVRDDENGSLLERLNAIQYIESYSTQKKKKFRVPLVVTAQDLTLHIPFVELSAFIKAEEAYIDDMAKKLPLLSETEKELIIAEITILRRDPKLVRKRILDEARDKASGVPQYRNPFENIEQLRQSLGKQKFLAEQFGVGMAFAFALCQLYGHHIAKKIILSKEELKVLKNHLQNVLKRNIRGTQFIQSLLQGKYDPEFKAGKTFMQIIHMDNGDKTYNYDDHMDYAQKVSDTLVDFCTQTPDVAKILMFAQYVRCKPDNVKRVVVADDREFELTEIKAHPWANLSSSNHSVPVVTLFVFNKKTSEEELSEQFTKQTPAVPPIPTTTHSAHVSPAVTPPSRGSSDEEKDKLRTKPSWLAQKLRLSKAKVPSNDDLVGLEEKGKSENKNSGRMGLKKKHLTASNIN